MGGMESLSAAGARRRAELDAQGRSVHAAALRAIGPVSALDDPDDLQDSEREPAADLRTLDGQLAILGGLLRERLRDRSRGLGREEVADVSQTLHDLYTIRFAIHDHLEHERLRRLHQLDRGLSELRRVTDQDELLEKACEAAATAGGFDRVMLSRVEGDQWYPWRSWSVTLGAPELAFRDWIRDLPRIRLSHLLLESGLVARREPGIVVDAAHDPRVFAPLAEAAALTSYVVAPVLSGDRVIGLLHADNPGTQVVELDRDVLWFFAIGFAQIFERAVLLARLRDQRAEVMRAMESVQTVLDELASSEIELSRRDHGTALVASRVVPPPAATRSPALESVLTSRELEVLALMATGATNERIAQRLVIATETVKSHVKQILRKLGVENRAEAISQYLRITIGAGEG